MKHTIPMPGPEMSRPVPVARVSAKGSHEKVVATADERVLLARRFGVPAIHSISAALFLKPWRGGGLKVTGEVACDLDQESVISLDNFRQNHVFAIEEYFLPEGTVVTPDDGADPIFNGEIDVGEVVAETIALGLDPYPRKPGEAFAERGDQ